MSQYLPVPVHFCAFSVAKVMDGVVKVCTSRSKLSARVSVPDASYPDQTLDVVVTSVMPSTALSLSPSTSSNVMGSVAGRSTVVDTDTCPRSMPITEPSMEKLNETSCTLRE